jgi:hypothetical protein
MYSTRSNSRRVEVSLVNFLGRVVIFKVYVARVQNLLQILFLEFVAAALNTQSQKPLRLLEFYSEILFSERFYLRKIVSIRKTR